MMDLEKWIAPALLRQSYLLLGHLGYLRYPKKHLFENLHRLEKRGLGRRAFLLATGPSLKKEDLSLLKGEDCYSVSNFFLHEQIESVAPKLHFFAPYHEPLILENYVEWLRKADQRLPHTTGIVLGHHTHRLVEEYGLFKERTVHYIYLSSWLGKRVAAGASPSSEIKITGPLISPQSGPLMILPVLLAMGYSKIYLLGCDHNVLKDYKQSIEHFYENGRDPRKNASDSNCWSGILQSLKAELGMFMQYKYYHELAMVQGASLINLSQGSWLDFIPSDSLSKVIERTSEPND